MSDDAALASVTLARLLADHGDVRRARRVLEAVLRRTPDDRQARALVERLQTARQTPPRRQTADPALPRREGRASELAGRFRRALAGTASVAGAVSRRTRTVARLERWLEAMRRPPIGETACPSRAADARLERRPDDRGTT